MNDIGAFLARWLRAAAAALERRSAAQPEFDRAPERDPLERTLAALRRRYPEAPEHWLRFVAERAPALYASGTGASTGSASEAARPNDAAADAEQDETAEREARGARLHREPRFAERAYELPTPPRGRTAAGFVGDSVASAAASPSHAERPAGRFVMRPRFRPQTPPAQGSTASTTRAGQVAVGVTALPRRDGLPDSFPKVETTETAATADKTSRVSTRFRFPLRRITHARHAESDATSAPPPDRTVPAAGPMQGEVRRAAAPLHRPPAPVHGPAAPMHRPALAVSAARGAETSRFAPLAASTAAPNPDGGTRRRPLPSRPGAAERPPGVSSRAPRFEPGPRLETPRTPAATAIAARANTVIAASTVDEPKWPELPPSRSVGPDARLAADGAQPPHFAEPPRAERPDRWNALPF